MTEARLEKPQRFIEYLRDLLDPEKHRDARGTAAALRRILAASDPGDPEDVRAYQYVEPFVQTESGWHRHAYYLVAGLYATHPEEDERTLCEALSDIWRREGQRDSLELRFRALVGADPDQLPDRLRRTVLYLRSRGEAFDYARLLADLLDWSRSDRQVQRRWSREFYGRLQADAEGQPPVRTEVKP